MAALPAAALAAQRHGAMDRAITLMQRRAQLANELAAPREGYDAQVQISRWEASRGRSNEAATALLGALGLAEEQNWRSEKVFALSRLSDLERRRAEYLAALGYQKRALAIARQLPATQTWQSLGSLAALYEQIELFDLAREHYELALEEASALGTAADVADAQVRLAGFLNDFGGAEAPRALSLAQRSLAFQKNVTDPVRIASAQLQIGRAQANLGQLDAAQGAYRQAYQAALSAQSKSMLAHVQLRWGELDLLRGNAKNALGRIQQAEAGYRAQGNRHRLIKLYASLESVYQALDRPLDAALAGREHFRLRNEVLGAGPSGKLGELITGFTINEERLRNADLRTENDLTQLRLDAERRVRQLSILSVIALTTALALLLWRHQRTRRLYAQLHQKEQALAQAHSHLTAKSAELYTASITDALTGLHNRRYAITELNTAVASGHPQALLLIDLDHFKAINDRYGHVNGDQVLIAVAKAMRDSAPVGSLLARVGGEEFVLIHSGGTRSQAMVIAEALRARVATTLIALEGQCIQTTLSIGVACVSSQHSLSAMTLMRQADSALYRAKSEGRNRVVAA